MIDFCKSLKNDIIRILISKSTRVRLSFMPKYMKRETDLSTIDITFKILLRRKGEKFSSQAIRVHRRIFVDHRPRCVFIFNRVASCISVALSLSFSSLLCIFKLPDTFRGSFPSFRIYSFSFPTSPWLQLQVFFDSFLKIACCPVNN